MKHVEICQTEVVHDVDALLVIAATFEGSKPFSGCFHVWDIDEMVREDPLTGKLVASVYCAFGDASYHEDSMIEIELIAVEAACSGFDGKVVRRMRWADEPGEISEASQKPVLEE